MTKKSYTFRLDQQLIHRVDQLGNNRTWSITEALKSYVGESNTFQYDNNTIAILQTEITDLKSQRDLLQKRIDYYSLPWYIKLFNRPQQPLLSKDVK